MVMTLGHLENTPQTALCHDLRRNIIGFLLPDFDKSGIIFHWNLEMMGLF